MIPSLRYAMLTIRHKWFVLVAGLRVGCPLWLLVLHDHSKFSRHELPHYGRQFFGDQGDPLGFSLAWLHHQRMNKHHWEAWIPITGHNRGGYADMEPLPMPDRYIREMVADWIGASRAYEGRWPTDGNWPWFDKNFDKIKLHPETRWQVRALLWRVMKRAASVDGERGEG